MALSFVDNLNPQNYNEKYITSKKFTKLPLISLKTNKNFHLVQNRKGKLLNKPIFSGYTKNKLSSIPRDVEIILLNKDKYEISSQYDKSPNTSRTNDYIFNNNIYINPYYKNDNINPGKGISRSISCHDSSYKSDNINNKTIMPISTNSSKSLSRIKSIKNKNNNGITKTPKYWNYYKKIENPNDISNNQNNLSLDEYKSQFYPGPSDYYGEKSFDKLNQQNKYRYKSLFKLEINNKNKKKKEESPGPGSYLKLNNILNNYNDNKHLSITLGRKEKRFKNLFNNNNPLSPWYYSSSPNINNNKNNKNTKNENINNKCLNKNNNKDCYDYRYYVIKEEIVDTGKKKQIYLEDKNHTMKESNTKIIIKPFDNIKFKEKRQFNFLLKKYINTNENNKYQVPGPGQYNIYMGFDKILKDNAIENLKNINRQEHLIPENVLKEFALNKKDPSLIGNKSIIDGKINKKGIVSKSSEDIFIQESSKNGNGTLPFISKKKKN